MGIFNLGKKKQKEAELKQQEEQKKKEQQERLKRQEKDVSDIQHHLKGAAAAFGSLSKGMFNRKKPEQSSEHEDVREAVHSIPSYSGPVTDRWANQDLNKIWRDMQNDLEGQKGELAAIRMNDSVFYQSPKDRTVREIPAWFVDFKELHPKEIKDPTRYEPLEKHIYDLEKDKQKSNDKNHEQSDSPEHDQSDQPKVQLAKEGQNEKFTVPELTEEEKHQRLQAVIEKVKRDGVVACHSFDNIEKKGTIEALRLATGLKDIKVVSPSKENSERYVSINDRYTTGIEPKGDSFAIGAGSQYQNSLQVLRDYGIEQKEFDGNQVKIPEQLVQLANSESEKTSTRTNCISGVQMARIREVTGEQVWKMAQAQKLGAVLMKEELEQFGLSKAVEREREKIAEITRQVHKGMNREFCIMKNRSRTACQCAFRAQAKYFVGYDERMLDADKKGFSFTVQAQPNEKLPGELVERITSKFPEAQLSNEGDRVSLENMQITEQSSPVNELRESINEYQQEVQYEPELEREEDHQL